MDFYATMSGAAFAILVLIWYELNEIKHYLKKISQKP